MIALDRGGHPEVLEILEYVPFAMIAVDLCGRILSANSQTETMFRYSAGELAGLPLDTLLPAAQRAPAFAFLDSHEAEGQLRARRKDGSEFPAEVHFRPAQMHDLPLHLGTIRDITASRQVEYDLRAEVAARDQFLAILSHELRSPLNAMLLAADLLLRDSGDSTRVRVLAEVILHNVRMQTRLVNDLLDLSRVSLGKLTVKRVPVRLDLLTAAVVSQFRPQVEEAALTLQADDLPPVWIVGDPERLRQILGNLVSNAIKFSTPGGTVTIELAVARGDVRLTVADTGIGIDPQLLESMFQLFSQGAMATDKKGLGIGLALVRQLTELHGGSVSAHSEGPGKGSRFTVMLPRYRN